MAELTRDRILDVARMLREWAAEPCPFFTGVLPSVGERQILEDAAKACDTALASLRSPVSEERIREITNLIVRDIEELPDRTSPDDWPEALIVTNSELREIVSEHIRAALRESAAPQGEPVDIVFDGPPGPEAGHFVEAESPPGRSIRLGEWVKRDDGYWALRFSPAQSAPEAFGHVWTWFQRRAQHIAESAKESGK